MDLYPLSVQVQVLLHASLLSLELAILLDTEVLEQMQRLAV